MNRLLILFLLGVSLGGKENVKIPSSQYHLNKFVIEYNLYVEGLNKGVVDIRQWKKVRKAWEEIE